MSNIRERLALHFDAEASMTSGPRDGRYQVQLILPIAGRPTPRPSFDPSP